MRARIIAAMAMLAAAAGCSHSSADGNDTASTTTYRTTATAAPATTTAAGDGTTISIPPAVAPDQGARDTALAYASAVCPFDWRQSYADQLAAALTRYATPSYATAHAYTPAQAAAAQQRMTADQSAQTCDAGTVTSLREAPNTATTQWVRVILTATATATGVPANSAATVYQYELTYDGAQWRVARDSQGG